MPPTTIRPAPHQREVIDQACQITNRDFSAYVCHAATEAAKAEVERHLKHQARVTLLSSPGEHLLKRARQQTTSIATTAQAS